MNNTCTTRKKRSMRGGPFHVSQKVDYGLFLLAALASGQNNTPQSIRAIAKDGKLSFSFLQKIAHILKRAGLVHSERGKIGGYRLGRSPRSITLKDIVEALEGKIGVVPCLGERASRQLSCPRLRFCRIRSQLRSINEEIEHSYLSKKLSDFISFPS